MCLCICLYVYMYVCECMQINVCKFTPAFLLSCCILVSGIGWPAMGDPDLDWLACYGLEVLVEAEVQKATTYQTISLATGTEFRIGQSDNSAQSQGALPKGLLPEGNP